MSEPNRLLRAARERLPSERAPGEPMTRAELADAISAWLWETTGTRYELDPHLVGKWERGTVRWPIPAYRCALRHILGAENDRELGFHPPRRAANQATSVPAVATSGPWTADTITADAQATAEHLLLTRRRVLGGAAILGGTGMLAPLAPWLEPLTDAGDLAARWGAFAVAEVEALEQIVAAFRGWRSTAALGSTAVTGQLSDVLHRLRGAPGGPLTDRVFVAAAELSKIGGAMAFDAGQHPAAHDHYVMAARLAKAGHNMIFGAVALAALARQQFDLGRPGDGLEIVALAQRGTTRTSTPGLRALLATRQAWGHAQRGEVYAFQAAADTAETAHGALDLTTEPRWLYGLDTAELNGVIGARYRDLSRHDPRHAHNAVHHIEQALAARHPSRARNRGFDLVSLGRAHLITGEPDRAAAAVQSAVPLLDRSRPGRLARRLADWYREATPFTTNAAIRDARDNIHTVMPQPA